MKRALAGGFFGALLFTVILHIPEALAQAVSPAASATDVLAALVGKDVAGTRFSASATTGNGFTCGGNLDGCFKMPGADFEIGSDGTYLYLGKKNSTTLRAKIGANLEFKGNGEALVNGPLDQYNAGYFKNAIGGPVLVDDAQGIRVAAKTLGTCGADTPEGAELDDAAAGGTSGARTRRCKCTSDGAGTPAYAWQNTATGTVGTATTCAP